jgi:hypothetical protein
VLGGVVQIRRHENLPLLDVPLSHPNISVESGSASSETLTENYIDSGWNTVDWKLHIFRR